MQDLNNGVTDTRWRSGLFWGLQLGGWGAAILLTIFVSAATFFPARDAVVLGLIRTAFGFIITCGLRYPYHYLRIRPGNLWLRGMAIFLISGVLSFFDGGVTLLASHVFGMDSSSMVSRQFLVGSTFMRWMVYWLWSLLYFGINFWLDTQHASLRRARSEAEARVGELRLLRAQVNPHFLFNALNSIQAGAGDPALVQSLTQALADYLRFSLDQKGDIQPLGVELDALENYLRVEKVRFEEKLDYRIMADPSARRLPAPIALVQPLLENAIKYGQRTSSWPLRVKVAAEVADGRLRVSVANSGKWVEPEAGRSTGIGLANLRRRLDLLYGGQADLVTETVGDEVQVSVLLPAAGGLL